MIKNRFYTIIVIVFVFLLVLLGRLFEIQVLDHDEHYFNAIAQQKNDKTIKALRGAIKDRRGEAAAFSRDEVTYYASTKEIKKDIIKRRIAGKFSKVFGKDSLHYINLLDTEEPYVILEKKASPSESAELTRFTAVGLYRYADHTRVYPLGDIAGQLLGYVNREGKGTAGLELFFDGKLEGEDGRILIEQDVVGRPVTFDEESTIKPKPGDDIYLTIDLMYQRILEEELRSGISEYGGESAVGIIADPATGELLAMASVPSFSPSEFSSQNPSDVKNLAITDPYEPGSTIKPVIMSILAEQSLIRINEKINTENGKYRYKNALFSDTHPFSQLSVKGILEQSSNIGMVKLGGRIPPDILFRSLRDYGFGTFTTIDLPAESAGMLKTPSEFAPLTREYIAHGYQISVTPLQMVMAYSALINGGYLYKPRIIKEIRDCDGKLVKKTESQVVRKVIGSETSELIQDWMVSVVENGIGKSASVKDVRLGGKTGTTQIWSKEGYSEGSYFSSFIGFVPEHNASLVCYIMYRDPVYGKYGSKVAAPVFQKVVSRLVKADPSILKGSGAAPHHDRKKRLMDNIITEIEEGNRNQREEIVMSNLPVKKADAFQGNFKKAIKKMPDLKNRSVRDATRLLTSLGIKYKIKGHGKVLSQSIVAGSKIVPGRVCELKCSTFRRKNNVTSAD